MIHGKTGNDFTLFASCDIVYLKDHAKGFVTSAALAKNNVHLHVTQIKEEGHKYLEFLQEGYKILYPEGTCTTSYDNIDLGKYTKQERRTFYACNRFIVAPEVMQADILLLDVDCFIMQHIDPPDADIGIFYRPNVDYKEWNGEAGKVAAGALYVGIDHKDFLKFASDFITSNRMEWFVDQVGLKRAYDNYPNKKYHIYDNKFMDWDFVKNTTIWTGKGPRKSLNAVYGNKHKEFKSKFPIKDKEYFKS